MHRCRDRLRRRRVRPLVLVDPPDRPGSDPAAAYVERDALAHALARLDPDHRIVVILRFGADLTVAEIAQRTGEREGTVKSRLHYEKTAALFLGAVPNFRVLLAATRAAIAASSGAGRPQPT